VALLLAGFSALLYGIADFSGGFAAGRSRLLSVLVLSQFLGTLIALGALVVMGHGVPASRDLAWGFLAGLSGSMGLFMLYGGIAKSIVAIVSPASAVVGAIIPVVFAVLSGERPSGTAMLGSALCLPAIFLLTWEGGAGKQSIRAALVYGVLAGLGFGVFFTALARCSPEAGAWPLVAARVASITAFVTAMLISREPFRVERKGLPATLIAGGADMSANILFLLASQSGMLSLVAIITSLFPARLAGLILALTGVGLISLR
jgi:drug/metabolite transporter (DMT)-like permease